MARRDRGAFTLIEVLVVVAIIALLISILLPSLSRAKEQARATTCLSQLKQFGVGFTTYSASNQLYLPWAGSWKYMLKRDRGELQPERAADFAKGEWDYANIGVLWRKYIARQTKLFYCPSNDSITPDHPRKGEKSFLSTAPVIPTPEDVPITAYKYATPVIPGKWPRDAGRDMYPDDSLSRGATDHGNWYKFVHENKAIAKPLLGPVPYGTRGNHPMHALLSDCYITNLAGFHIDGYNVLYSDYHARRVTDPGRIISRSDVTSCISSWVSVDKARDFEVWEYFSRNP